MRHLLQTPIEQPFSLRVHPESKNAAHPEGAVIFTSSNFLNRTEIDSTFSSVHLVAMPREEALGANLTGCPAFPIRWTVTD